MKTLIVIITLINLLLGTFGSYIIKHGHQVLHGDNIVKIVEKHDNLYVDDISQVLTSEFISEHGYYWVCVDSMGDECPSCQPHGSDLCKGSKTYLSLFDNDANAKCYCLLLNPDDKPKYAIYMDDGTDHYWDTFERIEIDDSDKHANDPSTYNCSVLPEVYLQHKCFLEQDNTTDYFDANYEVLVNITHELLEITAEEFKVHVDRKMGKVVVYYGNLNELVTFPSKMTYELKFTDLYSIIDHSEDARVEFSIPHEAFWRNMSLTWHVSTNNQWLYGSLPLSSGQVQWYPVSRPDDEFLVDPCTRPCGAFCYRTPECMTNKQKSIKMFSLLTFAGTLYFIAVTSIYVWWDLRKKTKLSGNTRDLTCGKRTLFCIAIVSLAVPSDGWGTCVSTAFAQSKLLVNTDSIDHHAITGNMFLSNMNGQSCFDVRDPEDETKTLMQAILEIEEANVIYDLQPQYTTYSSEIRSQVSEKCPNVLCLSIECGGICNEDRNCNEELSLDLSHPGRSSCYEPQAKRDCASSTYQLVACDRQRTIVGYSIHPKQWFLVAKLSNNPRIELLVKMRLDYLNGTVHEKSHLISATEPNMITPLFSIGDMHFYNNGISQTNIRPAKDYVMIHEGSATPDVYPHDTDAAYLVDASPALIKNKVGHLQCTADTRENCDFADDLCTIDVSRSGHEVACGIDPVASEAVHNNLLPLVSDNVSYKLSSDLKSVVARVENIGSLSLFMNGETALSSEVPNVEPVCDLVGVTNGCFMCTTGFWFKMRAKSTLDYGQAVVTISSRQENESRQVGIFNKIVTLSTSYQEFDIHGFTEIEKNELLVTVTSGENSCSFTIDFTAHFDNITAIATRSKTYINYLDSGDDVFSSSAIDDMGSFFGDFFGDSWEWLRWTLLVILIGLASCFFGPCLKYSSFLGARVGVSMSSSYRRVRVH